MLVRNKQGEKGIRLRRQSPRGITEPQISESAHLTEAAEQRSAVVTSERPTGRRRLAGPVEDTALYSCTCGFVFEADVSTSVGCPHCGSGQAW